MAEGGNAEDTACVMDDVELIVVEGSSNFTRQQPFRATEADLSINWGGRRGQFTCGLCDRTFEVGDIVRWVYVNKAPNVFVCAACDGSDVARRFADRWRKVIVPLLRRWGNE